MSKMMRISEKTAKNLDDLVKITQKTKLRILDEAIEAFAREQFLKKGNEEYAAFKENKKAYQEELDELAEWDITLLDGFKND